MQDNFYLNKKSEIYEKKILEKYPSAAIIWRDNNTGYMRIGFKDWSPKDKIILLLGNRKENTVWTNSTTFTSYLQSYGIIDNTCFESEYRGIFNIIECFLVEFKNI